MGRLSEVSRVAHIVDVLDAPEDSERSAGEFILGGLASQKWRAPTETGGVPWDEESGLRRSSSARRCAWR